MNAVRILLDENFPKSAESFLRECGHEVFGFADVCEFGDDDETVFRRAQKLGAMVFSSDRDFYHTMPLLHPIHCGIVVVALRQPSRDAILKRIEWFFDNCEPPFVNRVFILRDFSCRMK